MLSTLFGGSCYLCRGAARGLLCAACHGELPRIAEAVCPRCALPSPSGALCGRCLANAPGYDATAAALVYRFPTDALVHAFKFRGELALARLLAAEMLAKPPPAADFLLPVPLSAERLRERGYNQAMELARELARASGIALDATLCERRTHGAPQSELPLAERRGNVRGAFRCPRTISGTVAVVDDVMTTGATLDEIARALKDAGAERVVNWVVARTF